MSHELPFVNHPQIIAIQQVILDLNERLVKLENALALIQRSIPDFDGARDSLGGVYLDHHFLYEKQ